MQAILTISKKTQGLEKKTFVRHVQCIRFLTWKKTWLFFFLCLLQRDHYLNL